MFTRYADSEAALSFHFPSVKFLIEERETAGRMQNVMSVSEFQIVELIEA